MVASEKSSLHRQQVRLQMDGYRRLPACRSLMKWGGSFSTRQNISCPSESGFWMLSISSRAVCHADRRRGSWESHRVAVIVFATAAWMTPVTREGFLLSGEMSTSQKWLLSVWSVADTEIRINLCVLLTTLWPRLHVNIFFSGNSGSFWIYN